MIVALLFGMPLLALPACNMFERTKLCSQLSEASEETLLRVAELDSTTNSAAPADAYAEIARQYEQLDERLAPLSEVSDKELAGAVSAYRTVLRSSARECERYAMRLAELKRATEQDEKSKVAATTRQLTSLRNRMEKNQSAYAAASERIARLCAPK